MSRIRVHPATTLPVKRAWLRHSTKHSLSMPVTVASIDTTVQPITQSVLYVLGRSRPVPVNDGVRKSRTGNISVVLHSVAERVGWVALTLDGSPLAFSCPSGWGWEVSSGWMSLADISWSNPAGFGRDPWRIVSATFTLVDQPVS